MIKDVKEFYQWYKENGLDEDFITDVTMTLSMKLANKRSEERFIMSQKCGSGVQTDPPFCWTGHHLPV
ncbi:hypothetical protein [Bacillus changyiensis]|uniref:hypothetical protein n=1 Tax=Bacillus changyiensis TaxID=3004103 RepID=UPI0022E1AC6D|nr:hypothetical protein [Bacillus changyiensis]MDA1476118.1 hypothetical protein [Bacillus changyiensis]